MNIVNIINREFILFLSLYIRYSDLKKLNVVEIAYYVNLTFPIQQTVKR